MKLPSLIPRDRHLLDLIVEQSGIVKRGAQALKDFMYHYEEVEEKRKNIKSIESEADKFVLKVHEILNATFITPIDREDISTLTSKLDDILDFIEGISDRMVLYKVKEPTPYMIKLTDGILQATEEVYSAISKLKDLKNTKAIITHIEEINRIEHIGDEVARRAIADLFENRSQLDAIEIIKLKEIYEQFEEATDKCDDVADLVKDIVVKNT